MTVFWFSYYTLQKYDAKYNTMFKNSLILFRFVSYREVFSLPRV